MAEVTSVSSVCLTEDGAQFLHTDLTAEQRGRDGDCESREVK